MACETTAVPSSRVSTRRARAENIWKGPKSRGWIGTLPSERSCKHSTKASSQREGGGWQRAPRPDGVRAVVRHVASLLAPVVRVAVACAFEGAHPLRPPPPRRIERVMPRAAPVVRVASVAHPGLVAVLVGPAVVVRVAPHAALGRRRARRGRRAGRGRGD